MIDIHHKKWISHLIVAIGLMVGILLLYGLVINIMSLRGEKAGSIIPAASCKKCLTKEDINTTKVVRLGDIIGIELPESLYPLKNLTVIESMQGLLKKINETPAKNNGNWIVQYEVVKKGMADVVVQTNATTASDFRISLISE